MKKTIFSMSLMICHSVGALQCTSMENLTNSTGINWSSRVALNTAGTAVVTWVKAHEGNTQIVQTAIRPNGSVKWDQNQTCSISQPLTIESLYPHVTGDGVCTILWESREEKPSWIFAKKDPSMTWTSPTSIQIKAFSNILDVNFDKAGDPFVLASDPKVNGFSSFHFTTQEEPLLLTSKKEIPSLTTIGYKIPQIITNKKGDLAVVFVSLYEKSVISGWKTDQWLCVSFYNNLTNSWSAYDYVSPMGFINTNNKNETARDISGCMNTAHHIAMIWSHFNPSDSLHRLKSTTRFDKYAPKENEIDFSEAGFKESTIFVDEKGNTVAAWIKTHEKSDAVFVRYKLKANDAWQGEPKKLSTTGKNAEQIQINFLNDHFIVIWGESDTAQFKKTIHGATLKIEEAKPEWSAPTQLSPSELNCWYPSLACNETEALLSWTVHKKRSPYFNIQIGNLIVP